MAIYTHCCRAQPLRQLGFLVHCVGVDVAVSKFGPLEVNLTHDVKGKGRVPAKSLLT